MAKRSSVPRIQNRHTNVSLAPLKPEQALAGLLRVKPSDVKKLEAQERSAKKPKRKKK